MPSAGLQKIIIDTARIVHRMKNALNCRMSSEKFIKRDAILACCVHALRKISGMFLQGDCVEGP